MNCRLQLHVLYSRFVLPSVGRSVHLFHKAGRMLAVLCQTISRHGPATAVGMKEDGWCDRVGNMLHRVVGHMNFTGAGASLFPDE